MLAQLREKDHALKHEKEKLNRANEMLRNYKDDNAWLVDALHIAAEHAAGSGMPQGPSTVPVSGLRGMDVPVNSGGRGGNSSTPASAAPKKSSKSKRPKIKIGKDGVQRLVRE